MSTAVAGASAAQRRGRVVKWLLLLATAMFPLAVLAAGPIAFGIVLTSLNDHSPLLDVLAVVLIVDLLALAAGWVLYAVARLPRVTLWATLAALTFSALMLLTLTAGFVTASI